MVGRVSSNDVVLPAGTGALALRESSQGDVLVAVVTDTKLDARNSHALKRYLKERLETKPRRLVLDLAKVDFINSSGLGALLAGLKFAGLPGRLVIVRPAVAAQKVFQLTRTESLFRWADSVDAAVAAP
jgi:anti-sigma B factor antagonist